MLTISVDIKVDCQDQKAASGEVGPWVNLVSSTTGWLPKKALTQSTRM